MKNSVKALVSDIMPDVPIGKKIASQYYVDEIKAEVKNRDLVTPEGQRLGKIMANMADQGFEILKNEHGFKDDRCVSCAFREGTVPNGDPQTQLEVVDCVMNDKAAFACHCVQAGGERQVCSGWIAAKTARDNAKL